MGISNELSLTESTPRPYAFFSYAHEDAALVDALNEGLQDACEVETFVDRQETRPGDAFPSKIREGLERCTHFIGVFTPHSRNRKWFDFELNNALVKANDGKCTIIMVLSDLNAEALYADLRAVAAIELSDVGSAVAQIASTIAGTEFVAPVPAQDWDLWLHMPKEPDAFSILSWRIRLTQLFGPARDRYEDLLTWALDDNRRPSLRVVSGPGGTGKTRLAAELCQELRNRGWHSQILRYESKPAFNAAGVGVLYVIDYPEEQQDKLVTILREMDEIRSAPRPIRMLILSRNSIDWWRKRLSESHLEHAIDRGIDTGPLDERDTIRMFHEATERLTREYGGSTPKISDEEIGRWRQLAPTIHARPLFVVAAALHTVQNPHLPLAVERGEIMRALAAREIPRFNKEGEVLGIGRVVASRIVALAAISGRVDRRTLSRLSDPALDLGFEPGVHLPSTMPRLHMWRDGGVEAPKPDILAAALLFEVLREEEEFGGSERCAELIWATIEDVARNQSEELLDRVARLIYDVGTVYGQDGGRLTQWLIEMIESGPARARALARFAAHDRPPDPTLPVTIALNRTLRELSTDNALRAKYSTKLATHLVRSDRHDEAIEPMEETIRLQRDMAKSGDSRAQDDLAESLHVLSMALEIQGDVDRAQPVAEESVQIRRSLLDEGVESQNRLARSLNHLSIVLRRRRENARAIEAIEKVIEIYRGLTETESSNQKMEYEDGLARGLFNKSDVLLNMGQCEERKQAIEESASIRRRLFAEKPFRYGRWFAVTLHRLANAHFLLEELDRGREVLMECVTVRKKLAESNPLRFGADFLLTISEMMQVAMHAGNTGEAIKLLEQCDQEFSWLRDGGVLATLVAPVADLALRLSALGQEANESGHSDLGSRFCTSSLQFLHELRREAGDSWDVEAQTTLLASYLNRGISYRQQKTLDRAIDDYTKAIAAGDQMRAEFGQTADADTFTALVLRIRCLDLLELGRKEEALDDCERSLKLEAAAREKLGESWPQQSHVERLTLINTVAECLWVEECPEQAVALLSLAMDIADGLSARGGIEAQRICTTILQIGSQLVLMGRVREAEGYLIRGVELAEGALTQSDPPLTGRNRAVVLNNAAEAIARISEMRDSIDRIPQAEAWLGEAAEEGANWADIRLVVDDSLALVRFVRGRHDKDRSELVRARAEFARTVDAFETENSVNSKVNAMTARAYIEKIDVLLKSIE